MAIPEQEIPQEVLEAMTDRVMSQWTLFRDPQVFGRTAKPVSSPLLRSEVWTILEDALAAVLPDMQRPLLKEAEQAHERCTELLEEIAKRKNQVGYESHARLEAEAQVCRLEHLIETQWKPIEIERDSLLEEIERLRETSKALAQIADRRKDERDARPDLTAEEIEELLALRGPDAFFAEDHAVWKSARAKLERSLDAHKP